MIRDITLGIARHVLGGFAGALVAHGYLMAGQTEQLVGAGMFFVALALSAYNKTGKT